MRTLPGSWYADPAHHERELASVFGRDWVAVATEDDTAAPCTYQSVLVGGRTPVLLVRDEDGVLRAFLNVCRHRGSPVAEGCGTARALRCPYHAWIYRLDGSLARATGVGTPEEFDPATSGLKEVAVTTFCRNVFVNLAPDAPHDEPRRPEESSIRVTPPPEYPPSGPRPRKSSMSPRSTTAGRSRRPRPTVSRYRAISRRPAASRSAAAPIIPAARSAVTPTTAPRPRPLPVSSRSIQPRRS